MTHGNIGEIWFGEDSEDRVMEWLVGEYLPEIEEEDEGGGGKRGLETCSLLDLGTGNGHFLLQLVMIRKFGNILLETVMVFLPLCEIV